MRSQKAIVISLVLGVLLFSHFDRALSKSQGKHFNNHRGGQGAEHRSSAAGVNSNAQWSADPSRGWVRAEERRESRKPTLSPKVNLGKGKAKGNNKGY